jgi:hypothetical protein
MSPISYYPFLTIAFIMLNLAAMIEIISCKMHLNQTKENKKVSEMEDRV